MTANLSDVHYLTHKPAAPLSRFVDYLWSLSDAPRHAQERIVATGTQELVINLQENAFDIRRAGEEAHAQRLSGAMVSGAYSRYFVIDTRAHASLLGVHFRAGGAGPVLGVPPGELADRHADLEVLWGGAARELRDQLGEASNVHPANGLLRSVPSGTRFRCFQWLSTDSAVEQPRSPAERQSPDARATVKFIQDTRHP